MMPSGEHAPGEPGPGPVAAVLRAVRSGSVGISRLIWRVLSNINEERETRTRTDAHPAAAGTGGPAPPAPS